MRQSVLNRARLYAESDFFRLTSHFCNDFWLSLDGIPANKCSTLMSSSKSGQCIPRPSPISRHFFRSSCVPCNSLGYHTNGTAIVRPSSNSTISSSSVTFTFCAFASRKSIVKVFIPLLQNHLFSVFHQALYSPDFMCTKTAAILQSYRVEPKFSNLFLSLDMHMGRFIAVTGVEKETVRANTAYRGRHCILNRFSTGRDATLSDMISGGDVSLPFLLSRC